MLSIVTTLLIGLNTFNAQACEIENQHYVKRHFVEDKLIVDTEVKQEDFVAELKNAVVCEIKNEIMLDGLSFLLYQHDESNSAYIRVNNGLDGTSKLYGPFAH